MNNKIKVVGFVLFLVGILFINYKFNNIIVRMYNYVQKLPKILIASLSLMAVISPFLLKNNNIFEKLTGYIPTNNLLSKYINAGKQNPVDLVSELNKKYQPSKKVDNHEETPRNRNGEKGKKVKRNVSEQMKKYVAANQEWKCLECKNILDASYEVDHIIPLYKGGDNDSKNLQALCRNCHGSKTIRDKIEENKI